MKCPHCNKFIDLKSERIRSLPQNQYYWGVIIEILSEELGFNKDEMHEILKHKFLSKTVFLETKEKKMKALKIPKSTTNLKTVEFEEYLSDIRMWASMDLGIFIPEPNEEIKE
jgi:hypothetical protein